MDYLGRARFTIHQFLLIDSNNACNFAQSWRDSEVSQKTLTKCYNSSIRLQVASTNWKLLAKFWSRFQLGTKRRMRMDWGIRKQQKMRRYDWQRRGSLTAYCVEDARDRKDKGWSSESARRARRGGEAQRSDLVHVPSSSDYYWDSTLQQTRVNELFFLFQFESRWLKTEWSSGVCEEIDSDGWSELRLLTVAHFYLTATSALTLFVYQYGLEIGFHFPLRTLTSCRHLTRVIHYTQYWQRWQPSSSSYPG